MTYDYREFLTKELAARKQANARFSLRAFAQHLGVSPGYLSSLIRGKKRLTYRQAISLVKKLELSPEDKRMFVSSAFPELHSAEPSESTQQRLLQEDEFNLISDWYHYAILSLGSVTPNRWKASWIAERLGISEVQALDAMNRLRRLKLVSVFRGEGFKQSGRRLMTTQDVSSYAIKKFHHQTLDLAKLKLELVPPHLREFGAVTMAVNPARIDRAKKMIREFQSRMEKELEVGRRKSIYTLSVQLFPLSDVTVTS